MVRILFYCFLLFFSACIEPLVVNISVENRRLVVDGLITDAPEPYNVKLFYSHKLGTSKLVPFEAVTGAIVFIVDNLNNEFFLSEIKPGLYTSAEVDFTGQIGRSYHVVIKTTNDKVYKSEPQVLKVSGEIAKVYFDFEKGGLPGNQSNSFIDALKVYIDAKGDKDGTNLYRWRWKTIHKVISSPELETVSTPGGERPTPEPCSGYVVRGGQIVKVGDCTCCICWSYNYSESAHVSKNRFVNESIFNKQDVGKIPITGMHFYDKYYIEVEQLSLSEMAYDFWDLIEKQQTGTTNLFQPNAINIKGNIRNTTNEDEEVLGFFGVSGIVKKSLYIDKQIIPAELSEIEIIRYSCKAYFKNATTDKPTFW